MELAVIGGSGFTLGFGLSGIRRIVDAEADPAKAFRQVMQEPDIGIIVTDEETMSRLDELLREDVERSVRPVVVVLSAEATQESLRKMIKKSIGVDLLKD